ncbi:biotin carboxylase N-terminal domain-containing protein [Frankia sp. ACN1ag]|uniref:ATP-binding protein n=1 Tax=Frankia sp. ACN1ag TaxID=102891 RepID=UPI0006DC6F69|nr:biotin carboxylase N-terminal domain-containing protein [Frankia sp. ACN1ag]KQC36562.1 acetyl/propionyl-CoA carboxylase subuit alpha [Frankia sp. ACN1ag]
MITKLLVANRGEIAVRIIRTAHEMDIATVAVFSDPDAGAPFVAAADEAVRLPGATPAETYLRADLVIDAALRVGADAVHPGYGFLSENADFARACAQAGIVFVGPPPEAIEAMGSKTRAKELMGAAGVPVLPGLIVDDELLAEPDRLLKAAAELDFPVLVKAVYGGGGRGMRIVHDLGALADAVAGARREAASAFGDGTVFLEHYVWRPRHVEVQVFADTHGDVVHLFERECSIQRRYQKIIEEAPSVAVDEHLRERLGSAAVAAAAAIGYVGAGTVEFVLDRTGRFFFLEVNTRLQVEHPVTEQVTGLDLVRAQLLVAQGAPLPAELRHARITGHAVEARLYAEDVPAGFLPATGTIHRFDVPTFDGVRVDSGVADGSVVGVHYDPMLAKVIAHGATRDEAIRRLARALAGTRVHGVTTNRELLVAVLRDEEFRSGDIDTGYLDRHDAVAMGSPATSADVLATHLVAAALTAAAERRATGILPTAPPGWRNVPTSPQRAVFALSGSGSSGLGASGREVEVTYRWRADRVDVTVDGRDRDVVVHRLDGEQADLTVDDVRSTVRVHRVGPEVYLDGRGGSTVARETPRFVEPGASAAAGSLTAPMPGTVVRVAVERGAAVTAGEVVLVLEAMKMEHAVTAPHDGVLHELDVRPGQTVDGGHVLAVITPGPAR